MTLLTTGCSTSADGHPISTSFAHGVLAAEQNSGPEPDQDAVRAAVTAALTDENQIFVIDEHLRGQLPAVVLSMVTTPAAHATRATLLARNWSPPLASSLLDSFTFYAHQEFRPHWSGQGTRAAWLDRDVIASTTFHVDQWQGVQVAGSTARVLVHGEYRGSCWGGTPKNDLWAQYQLILHRDTTATHGWRVTKEKAATTAP